MAVKKNILHINSYFITNKLHGELVKKMDEKGYSQTVFIPVENKNQIGLNHIESLNYTNLIYDKCFNSITRFIWPVKMVQIWHRLKKIMKTVDKPDIIHAHSLFVNGLIAWNYARKSNLPFVVTVRNTDINIFFKKNILFRRLGEKILLSADGVMFLSPAYRDLQLKKYIKAEVFNSIQNKTAIIHNGINDFWLENRITKSRKINKTNIKILFSGKIRENKNLRGLLSAVEIVKKKGYTISVEVVGNGPLINELKRNKFPVEVTFHGFISDKQKLIEIYRSCDIMAVPSFRESFGLIYAEGLSQGLPALYSKGQGFDGNFPDGFIGYAVNPYEIKNIAERIEECIKNYEILSKNAVNVASQFSWNNTTEKLISLYNSAFNQQ